jgi:hypothetical protein
VVTITNAAGSRAAWVICAFVPVAIIYSWLLLIRFVQQICSAQDERWFEKAWPRRLLLSSTTLMDRFQSTPFGEETTRNLVRYVSERVSNRAHMKDQLRQRHTQCCLPQHRYYLLHRKSLLLQEKSPSRFCRRLALYRSGLAPIFDTTG